MSWHSWHRVHGNLIGKSEAMRIVFDIIDNVAPTNATVLIEGETGTGKEVVARFIHFNGPRVEYPLISTNCCQFTETLLESELFGHARGAFTGGQLVKKGKFREDLYYRLNVIRIGLPPLKERKEDIPVLVDSFSEELRRNCAAISRRSLKR